MGRPLRIDFPDAVHHIICKGNRDQPIFYDDKDRNYFLKKLKEYKFLYNFKCICYCLMKNHFHLLIKTSTVPIWKIMHSLASVYAHYFNRKYNITGHLFQRRYKNIIVDTEQYLLTLSRYIHLNPVKAHIVDAPELYKWSSCKAYFEKGKNDIVDKEIILKKLSNNNDEAVKIYKDFLAHTIDWEPKITRVNNYLFLAEKTFIDKVLQNAKMDRRKYKRDIYIVTPDEIINFVCKKFNLEKEKFIKKGKHKIYSKARKICIYLMRKMCHLTNTEIGKILGITKSNVSMSYSKVVELVNENEKENWIVEASKWLKSKN